MKLKIFSAALMTGLLFSCSNSDSSDEHKDSANTLQDTFPANGLKDSVGLDSDAADATHVDSLNKINQ
jgi:hypothetical protein